ncbi:chaperone protein DnaJ [Nitzschia inconspicua]|uniref:Chaperone protein DnaJ n=1 Tax=Nitzschia inconspicua TaxID=303405 RepID=A0A9K3PS58_9STRA|nr:chaperone protein DnaJ [Nitzschia inconspicua]
MKRFPLLRVKTGCGGLLVDSCLDCYRPGLGTLTSSGLRDVRDLIGSLVYYCFHSRKHIQRGRELSHVASFGAPVFSKIARNQLQYSVESVDSFRKFVYDEVVEGKAKQKQDEVMTKAEARETLGLINNININNNTTTNGASDISKSEIKQAYRKLSFDLHPDRFQGTPEECEAAAHQFSKVKIAYETLSSDVRGLDGISWYESLGGRARTGFVGPINLLPLAAAQEHLSRHKAEGAICGLDPVLVQSFVARHLRSE